MFALGISDLHGYVCSYRSLQIEISREYKRVSKHERLLSLDSLWFQTPRSLLSCVGLLRVMEYFYTLWNINFDHKVFYIP